jgi:hypothetical protein
VLKLQIVEHIADFGSKNSNRKPALIEINWNTLKNGIKCHFFFRDVFERFYAPNESFFGWMVKP